METIAQEKWSAWRRKVESLEQLRRFADFCRRASNECVRYADKEFWITEWLATRNEIFSRTGAYS